MTCAGWTGKDETKRASQRETALVYGARRASVVLRYVVRRTERVVRRTCALVEPSVRHSRSPPGAQPSSAPASPLCAAKLVLPPNTAPPCLAEKAPNSAPSRGCGAPPLPPHGRRRALRDKGGDHAWGVSFSCSCRLLCCEQLTLGGPLRLLHDEDVAPSAPLSGQWPSTGKGDRLAASHVGRERDGPPSWRPGQRLASRGKDCRGGIGTHKCDGQ